MRASGIDILVLHISFSDMPTNSEGIWGYITDDSYQNLRPQQQTNIQNIADYAAQIGFRKVFLRFDYQDYQNWTSWNESEYEIAWNFIVNVRAIVANRLKNSATRLMVDLGGEQIGLSCPDSNKTCQYKPYVSRLWSDYTYVFGNTDTVGFSFIGCSWIVSSGLTWYGPIKPAQYAFDNYGGCTGSSTWQNDVSAAWQALGSEKSKPLMIMETYSNNSSIASQVPGLLAANPAMNLVDLVQWPTTGQASCPSCDTKIQDGPVNDPKTKTTLVSNYLPIAKPVATDDLNPTLLKIDTTACGSGAASSCAQFHIGYAPVGANNTWQVFVIVNNGTRALWGCGGSAIISSNTFMVKGNSYRYDYFKVTNCSANPTSTPDATSYIAFR